MAKNNNRSDRINEKNADFPCVEKVEEYLIKNKIYKNKGEKNYKMINNISEPNINTKDILNRNYIKKANSNLIGNKIIKRMISERNDVEIKGEKEKHNSEISENNNSIEQTIHKQSLSGDIPNPYAQNQLEKENDLKNSKSAEMQKEKINKNISDTKDTKLDSITNNPSYLTNEKIINNNENSQIPKKKIKRNIDMNIDEDENDDNINIDKINEEINKKLKIYTDKEKHSSEISENNNSIEQTIIKQSLSGDIPNPYAQNQLEKENKKY